MLGPRETATNFGSCFRIIHALPQKTIATIVFRVFNSAVPSLCGGRKKAPGFSGRILRGAGEMGTATTRLSVRESPCCVAVLAAHRDLTDSHRHTNAFVDWCLAAAKPAVHLCIRAVHQRVPRLGTRSN